MFRSVEEPVLRNFHKHCVTCKSAYVEPLLDKSGVN